MANFDRYYEMLKVDAHMHYNTDRAAMLELAQQENFRFISFNTDIYFFPKVLDQERIVLNQKKKYGNRIDYICTFESIGFYNHKWIQRSIDVIKLSLQNGALGVKIWKNWGMELRDENNQLVMVDDPILEPLLSFLEKEQIPLTAHLGEPKNCWLPLDKMTVGQDRAYYAAHPEYHMYLHPLFPSYEEQLIARDIVIRKHPKLLFCGAHFASLEWSIEEMAKHLDTFPNVMMDTAERICHLQLQSINRYTEVRNFVIKYQDRIIYGTDVIDDGSFSNEEIKTHLKKVWDRHWLYFTTSEIQTSHKVEGYFKGLDLPWDVLEKIYFRNAEKFYKLNPIKEI